MTVAAAPAWHAYADASRVDHFAWWAETYCVQTIDQFAGDPLVFEDWQLEIDGEVLAEEADGAPYWLSIVEIEPRKNGKTTRKAAKALYHLDVDDGAPEILLGAATDKQAGRLFGTATAFVRANSVLAARFVVREHEGQIARADGGGVLYRFSADTGAAAGWNPSLVIVDELADWNTPRRERSWAQVVTAGRIARKRAQVDAISTAAEPHQRALGILGQMLDRNETEGEVERVHRGLTISRNHRSRTIVFNYCANTEDPNDLDAIKAANPASWVTRERLEATAAEPGLTPGRFLQLHGCVWASSQGAFLTLDEWRDLQDGTLALVAKDELLVGFRGGESWALVGCRRVDGALFVLGASDEPAVGAPATAEVDETLQGALATHRVGAIFASASPEWRSLVDGWRQELGRKRVVDVRVEMPGPRTAQIVERFRADARAGAVSHDGDRRLTGGVLAARMAVSRGHSYLVADVRHQAPIAAAHAAVLAWEARAVIPPGPDGGLVGAVSDYRIEQL